MPRECQSPDGGESWPVPDLVVVEAAVDEAVADAAESIDDVMALWLDYGGEAGA